MSDNDVHIDSAPVDIEVTGAQGPSLGGGASDVGDLTTTGLTEGNLLRVAAAGGLEQRTPSQVRSDIGAAANLGSDDNYVTDAEKVKLSNLSGTNTGDQNLSGYLTTSTAASTYAPISHNHAGQNLTPASLSSAGGVAGADTISGFSWVIQGSSVLTGLAIYTPPNASGVMALTADATGIPDKLHNSTISGTVAFSGGADATFRTVGSMAKSGANTDITSITSTTALTLASAAASNVNLTPGAGAGTNIIANATGDRGLFVSQHTSDSTPAATVWRKSRGSSSSPSAVQSGDNLGFFGFRGYHSGGSFHSASAVYLQVTATENYTSGAQGAYLDIATTPTGTASAAVVSRFSANGTVLIGTTTDPSLGKLHVAGRITSTAGIRATPVTVGTLPTASTAPYDFYSVTDSLTPTAGATVSAGGSAKALVQSNGTNWIVISPL